MKLTKSIIDEIVSCIDFADIRVFVQNHPELVTEEEFLESLIFDSLIIKTKINKIDNLDFYINLKGCEENV